MKAMILAAGRGERMGELTQNIPKPLINVGNTTLLEHNLCRIKDAGINDVVINISWLGKKISDYLENLDLDLNLTILDESNKMLGTGGGIKNALPYLGSDPFYLVNADVYSDYKIDIAKCLLPNTLGHLVLVSNPKHHVRGDFCLNDGFLSVDVVPRPLTFSGISLLSPNLLDKYIDDIFPLEPVLEKAASKGHLTGEVYNGLWIDVGNLERLNRVEVINNNPK